MPQRKKPPPDLRDAGNAFDRLLKLILAAPVPRLLIDAYHIDFKHIRLLKEKLQTTTEREVDYLSLIENQQGEKTIIHIEFQVKHDPDMIFRLQEYHGILSRKYQLPIRHFVFYFGDAVVQPRTTLEENLVFKQYQQLHFKQLDYRQFVAADSGYEILLGLLADFGRQSPEGVIREILDRLASLDNTEHQLKIWHQQLIVLAKLRNLEDKTIEILNNMPITIDLKGSFGYNEGLADGISKGKELGFREGERIGEQKGERKGELMGLQKGERKGLQKGERKGLQKGKLLGQLEAITSIMENEITLLSRMIDKQLSRELMASLSALPEDMLQAITDNYTPEKARRLLRAIRKAHHKAEPEACQYAVVQALVRYGVAEDMAQAYWIHKKTQP